MYSKLLIQLHTYVEKAKVAELSKTKQKTHADIWSDVGHLSKTLIIGVTVFHFINFMNFPRSSFFLFWFSTHEPIRPSYIAKWEMIMKK